MIRPDPGRTDRLPAGLSAGSPAGGRPRPRPSTGAPQGPHREIACDESGSEGEKLVGGNTKVFAHAGLGLDVESAAACMRAVRDRAPSPTTEYKAFILLRSKHRQARAWLLGPSGPLLGNAHVYLIDKAFFVVRTVIELLPADGDDPADLAAAFYREGQGALGHARWTAFLAACNDLLRTRNGRGPGVSVEEVFHLVESLRTAGVGGPTGAVMDRLAAARPLVEAFRARLLGDPPQMPVLDPLVPAIVQAVDRWAEGDGVLSIVHDRQTMLTDERIAQLRAHPVVRRGSAHGRLADVRLVDSRTDPRIQVADLLAGAARKIAEDELDGRGDAELTELLRPYIAPASIWMDGFGPARAG
ncbi:DUF3800 domain-containing protein [Nonomuraea sp. NPDC003804]|uniref:DUF3800 domain-containing protein n=1 Tax=Nonomuraea sp. NPDC003804 TaxID=3154547 RepID=UPI0033B5B76A